jgi:predicted transcriptional regulator of viral defense system
VTRQTLIAAEDTFRRAGGMMRTSHVLSQGVERRTPYWMRDHGLVESPSRGVYHLASEPLPPHPDLTVVALRVPSAVVCLVSALDFHEVTTQVPSVVEIALPRGAKAPRIECPPTRVYRMSGAAMTEGVEEHREDGVVIRVFSLAKTVADCFKFRSRVGTDVAVEALREAIRDRRVSPSEIMRFAQVDHVERVIRPYLEALQ